jgi:Zn-dependent peptidase ImmA (M78 family)/transcriptional regulator with XRE-family HTH domain
MERIHSINPARIAWCCADQGIALETLASEVGISLSSLLKLVAGEDNGLTFGQLTKIANYFGRGVLFFMESEPVNEERVHTPAFRTLANQKPELSAKLRVLIERVERQRSIYLGLREELDDADFPQYSPPEIPTGAREAASIVRTWLELGEQNTFETYRMALEKKGVLVFRSNGYNGKWQIGADSPILGFSLYYEDCPLIVVKKQDADSQQSFTLMHELGHLLLHKASSIDDETDMYSHQGMERDANSFAGHLLVPNEFLRQIKDAERPIDVTGYDDWLTLYRRRWSVSGEVILRRLLDTGRLTQQQYAAYREAKANASPAPASKGSRMFRHREPKHIFGDTFVRTVLGALSSRRITLAKASTYLDGLKISDVHALERHYAGL